MPASMPTTLRTTLGSKRRPNDAGLGRPGREKLPVVPKTESDMHDSTLQYNGKCIVESIHGTWHYHIALVNSSGTALCGARTMSTRIPWNSWGFKLEHILMSYCKKCEEQR